MRADIFSLGVTLWYLLTGRVPFVGRTLAEIHERQTRHPLPVEQLAGAAVPAPVVALLRSLLAPDPAARPQNARELAAALRVCQQRLAGPRARRAWMLAGAAVTLIALVSAATLLLGGRAGRRPVSPRSVAPAAVPEKSIAVLPFTNLGGDPANAFLADGMQDEILTDLARVADLKVISRTSVMAYRDAPRPNVRDIGRDLGVAYVLEGSVAREGGQVRVTAQLIDARTDAHVWAERYDRPADSLFAHPGRGRRADRRPPAQVRLTAAEQRRHAAEPPTADLTAYELYLHANESRHPLRQATPDCARRPRTVRPPPRRRHGARPRLPPRLLPAERTSTSILYHAGPRRHRPACLDRARDALAAAAPPCSPDAGETHYAAALLAVLGACPTVPSSPRRTRPGPSRAGPTTPRVLLPRRRDLAHDATPAGPERRPPLATERSRTLDPRD